MPRILITGASGFLGWYLCHEAQHRGWKVYGTAFSQQPLMPFVQWHSLNLTDLEATQSLVQTLQPQAVIHAAAMGRPNDCERHPEDSYAINVLATEHLAHVCRDLGIEFVFISTEQVFDGLHAPYCESDPVSPINRYGEHKAIAEEKVLTCSSDFLICRMPLMFGAVPHAPSFLQGFIERIHQGEILQLFVDEFRTPLVGWEAAQGIFMGLEQGQGLLHLGGAERISRYEFGRQLMQVLQRPEDGIQPCRQADVPMAASRPPDLSLDYSLAANLGYQPTLVFTTLVKLIQRKD